ncbi:M15 family metallopeptidase [Deinococcus sp. 6YEL10]|uniref:M15 family metallopeptidase n=1 Tax=Deinococcus sp. 6YEL10 TaxID=2745870 RepID=UPI001E33AAF7|nr:M15 family metallopeptidase [Deinococcus sp. 6YEL10]
MTASQDRDLNHLHPYARERLEPWRAAVAKAGFNYLIYETFRTPQRQAHLYAQGRTKPGAVVTYTLDSTHEYGLATDGVPLVWDKARQAWGQDWSHAAYDRIYKAVPPSKYDLELLSWEKPHLQVRGVNGPNQDQSASLFAARVLGIKSNQLVGSVWPKPVAPKAAASAQAPVTQGVLGRVLVPSRAGGWVDVRGQRLVVPATGTTVVINATAQDGDVYLGGLLHPER